MKSSDQAFPTFNAQTGVTYLGMSLRDYFAGQVMPSLLNRHGLTDDIIQMIKSVGYSKTAYSLADDLLEVRCHDVGS